VPLVLDLVRHGEAGKSSGSDRERRLTPKGREALKHLGERLAREDWRPDRVVSSPYPRARESAEIVAAVTRIGIEVEEWSELEPDRNPDDVLTAIATHGTSAAHWALFGHQPLMGRLSARLLGSEQNFATGDLVRIRWGAGDGPENGRLIKAIRSGA
jgi:phosphohistidine phosphatase